MIIILKLLLVSICVGTIISYLGQFYWFLELFSHFKVYYLVAATILLFLFIILKFPVLAIISIAVLVINTAEIVPWYIKGGESSAGGKNYRFMVSNIMKYNNKYDLYIDSVLNADPDFLGVLESDREWLENTKEIKKIFPYSIEKPRSGRFGIALYSKYKLSNIKIKHFGLRKLQTIVAEAELDQEKITIVLVHPSPPVTPYFANDRNIYFEQLTDYINKINGPKIVIGDFNITMWSPIYKLFIKKTGLVNTRKGFGIIPTWPTHLKFLPLMMIPIDHCIISEGLKSTGVKRGRNTGSDHFPLVCDIEFINN